MEMSMSLISSTAEPSSYSAGAGPGGLAAALTRLCAAYVTWRMERMAVAALRSMSDRELRDIGLARSEIGSAVRIGVHHDRALAGA
jgi:uncharacterized protein YjiS (DUF1127 family)